MEPIFLKLSKRGYTLLELIVVLAIIGILAVVIIVGQGQFNSSTLLTDTAYTVALSVRETQTLGYSSRYAVAGAVNNAGYGVHFGDSPTSYLQFADIYPAVGSELNLSYCPHAPADSGTPAERPGNCVYDSTHNEKVQQYSFSNGYTISKIWYYPTIGVPTYFTPGGGRTVDIVYERPNTQTQMSTSIFGITTQISKAIIEIASPQGGTRCVVITSLGEVYEAEGTTCP